MRVLIAGDDPLLIEQLPPLLLRAGQPIYLCAALADLLDAVLNDDLELIILGPGLAAEDELFTFCSIIRRESAAKLLLACHHRNAFERLSALKAGADDIAMTPLDVDDLLFRADMLLHQQARERLIRRGGIVHPIQRRHAFKRAVPQKLPESGIEPLTPREDEVLRLMAGGYHNGEIAQILCLSVKTVEYHVSHVLAKLNARSRADAIQRAHQQGIVHLEKRRQDRP